MLYLVNWRLRIVTMTLPHALQHNSPPHSQSLHHNVSHDVPRSCSSVADSILILCSCIILIWRCYPVSFCCSFVGSWYSCALQILTQRMLYCACCLSQLQYKSCTVPIETVSKATELLEIKFAVRYSFSRKKQNTEVTSLFNHAHKESS